MKVWVAGYLEVTEDGEEFEHLIGLFFTDKEKGKQWMRDQKEEAFIVGGELTIKGWEDAQEQTEQTQADENAQAA